MDTLTGLIGSVERIKLLRLFMAKSDRTLSVSDIMESAQMTESQVKREIDYLYEIKFLEKQKHTPSLIVEEKSDKESDDISFPFSSKKSKAKKILKPKTRDNSGYIMTKKFPHRDALYDLLFNFEALTDDEIYAQIKPIGRIKLLVRAGIFVGSERKRVDLLIVGEPVDKDIAVEVFSEFEAILGTEITYAIMDVDEYKYRENMCDKFIEDIRLYPHVVVIDRLTGVIDRLEQN